MKGIVYPLLPILCLTAPTSDAARGTKRQTDSRSVPMIAQLLGVRVGDNGQRALERRLGPGVASIGGHPNSRQLWQTRSPPGLIETDGFNLNREGYVLETLSWSLRLPSESFNRSLPAAKRHSRDGWLGIIYPGMTKQQVAKLTAGRLPPPQKRGNLWTWKAKGFVPVEVANDSQAYDSWTATLSFRSERLIRIRVECE